MAALNDVFDEHLGVVAALKENYTRSDDIGAVTSIASVRDEVAQLCTAREEQVAEAIRGLTQVVAATEKEATYPKDESAHPQQVAQLQTQQTEAREEVKRLEDAIAALEAERRALKTDFDDLKKKGENLEKLVQEVEPQTRHQLSLYAHISKITWQFDAADAHIAGAVSDPSTGDIRHFDVDPSSMSQFEITNHLWGLMEQA